MAILIELLDLLQGMRYKDIRIEKHELPWEIYFPDDTYGPGHLPIWFWRVAMVNPLLFAAVNGLRLSDYLTLSGRIVTPMDFLSCRDRRLPVPAWVKTVLIRSGMVSNLSRPDRPDVS